jgi:hypothetical protein
MDVRQWHVSGVGSHGRRGPPAAEPTSEPAPHPPGAGAGHNGQTPKSPH